MRFFKTIAFCLYVLCGFLVQIPQPLAPQIRQCHCKRFDGARNGFAHTSGRGETKGSARVHVVSFIGRSRVPTHTNIIITGLGRRWAESIEIRKKGELGDG